MSGALLEEEVAAAERDVTVPCCVKRCALPGQWVFVCRCGWRFLPWCDPHLSVEQSDIVRLRDVGCPACMRFVRGVAWQTLFTVVPIGAAT